VDGPLYETLDVWQLAHQMALWVYRQTENFPVREQFGLAAQLRRAAGSIPANLAEGCGRASTREYIHFCSIARGSVFEVRYYLRLAHDLGYLASSTYGDLIAGYDRVGKMVHFLMTALERRNRHVQGRFHE
jgi:four helix bundle protein